MADMLWIMKIVLKKELHYGYILYEQRITLGKMHIVDFYLKKMKTMACPKNPVKYVKSDSIGPKFADMLCMNIVLVFSDSAICFFNIWTQISSQGCYNLLLHQLWCFEKHRIFKHVKYVNSDKAGC